LDTVVVFPPDGRQSVTTATMSATAKKRELCLEGIIRLIDPRGVAVIEELGAKPHRMHAITFDKIAGYVGGTVAEMNEQGIKVGARVRFSAPNNRVDYVEVA